MVAFLFLPRVFGFWVFFCTSLYVSPSPVNVLMEVLSPLVPCLEPILLTEQGRKPTGVRVNTVEDLRVFLLVCGLRKVKDPLYLLKAFSEWHAENPRVILIIIGPKVDFAFSAEVEECVRRSDGVFLAAERSQEELHTVMQKSFALVNSSVSEGMSAAILEAMDLGVPVLARDIPGNAAIVKHEMSGLLYSSPEEFVSLSKRLLSDAELQETLKKNGKRYVSECHSSAKERTTYRQLVDMLH
uniref:Glycosyl transferase family 1 domain-containing protein n=1 Tax=Pygocentrus nattereri TaxID=42514 RepID=A0AAR2JZ87_PYGNA